VVTHDVEFAATVADRIAVMAAGEIIQSGTATQVLGTSALFAPQVAKVLYPSHWLTPYQVGQALA
ncbi:MAG: cobalt ABC transporter ATP-binding protein, partial [Propionibacteriaceae bacterium]|nr:cobalt ABC transporter ATP-binding protein [Propionibacteriaceae bacterium]